VLSIGAERLAAERGASHGEALEAAVLASLQVLVTALSMDTDMVAALRDQGRAVRVDTIKIRVEGAHGCMIKASI
jgi:hypothetical protein